MYRKLLEGKNSFGFERICNHEYIKCFTGVILFKMMLGRRNNNAIFFISRYQYCNAFITLRLDFRKKLSPGKKIVRKKLK